MYIMHIYKTGCYLCLFFIQFSITYIIMNTISGFNSKPAWPIFVKFCARKMYIIAQLIGYKNYPKYIRNFFCLNYQVIFTNKTGIFNSTVIDLEKLLRILIWIDLVRYGDLSTLARYGTYPCGWHITYDRSCETFFWRNLDLSFYDFDINSYT